MPRKPSLAGGLVLCGVLWLLLARLISPPIWPLGELAASATPTGGAAARRLAFAAIGDWGVALGLDRIVVLYYCSSTLYKIC
jgi:hypothetical protein